MRSPITFAFVSAFVLASPCPATAQQHPNDERVCSALRDSGRKGLFIAYNDQREISYRAVNGGALNYRPNARFYFLPPPIGGEEGVWHIRTQTTAQAEWGTDRAYLYRPAVQTRCQRKRGRGNLEDLRPNERFYDLNSYVEHHGPGPDGAWNERVHAPLFHRFHFEIEDGQAPGGCLRTDDRAFNKWAIYGFEGVSRVPTRTAQQLQFVGPAHAGTLPAPRHDSVSSEFTYHEGPGAFCFGFNAPVPTHSQAGGTSETWGPQKTSIRIQRLRGRNVSRATERDIQINWQ